MFSIDHQSRIPVYEQVVAQIERFVMLGLLQSGSPLPSVRSLALELSANPNTVQKAYTELDRRGVTSSAPGKGSFIAKDAKEVLQKAKSSEIEQIKKSAFDCALAGIEKTLAIDAVEQGYVSATAN